MEIKEPVFELLFDLKRMFDDSNVITTQLFGSSKTPFLQIYISESIYEVHLINDKLVIKDTDVGNEEWDSVAAIYFRLMGLMEKEIKEETEAWADIERNTPSLSVLLDLVQDTKQSRHVEINTMPTIKEDTKIVKCICCDKEIEVDEHGCLDHAGHCYLEFGYGSRHDQCKGFRGKFLREDSDAQHRLLACDNITAYICDDCAEKKFPICQGYVKQAEYKWQRKV